MESLLYLYAKKKNWKYAISIQRVCAKSVKFLCKKLCSLLPLLKAFQRAIKCINPMAGSGSKYRFSHED